jgi:hypothetical protein
MKSYWYYRSKGGERLAHLEKHLEEYHDSITDVPAYCVIFFYAFMSLISPKRKDKMKYDP